MKFLALCTLAKKNIKERKGNFIAILFLLTVAMFSISVCLGIGRGAEKRLEKVVNESNVADMTSYIASKKLTGEMERKLKACKAIEKVNFRQSVSVSTNNVKVAGKKYQNSLFLTTYDEKEHCYEKFAEDGSSLGNEKLTVPGAGEIYLPISAKDVYGCKVGDEVTFYFGKKEKNLKIAAFYQEPFTGCSFIGIKMYLVNGEELELFSGNQVQGFQDCTMLEIYGTKKYQDNAALLKKEADKDCGIVTESIYTFSKADSMKYTLLFVNIINGVLIAFGVLLFVITLLVIGNAVSSMVESKFKDFGILKAQGFTSNQISLSMIIEYIAAGGIGSVFGIILSIPVIQMLGNVYIGIIGVVIEGKPDVGLTVGLFLMIMVLIAGYCYIKTRKIRKISPVQAIAQGMPSVHFTGRADFSITACKKLPLTVVLAWKEFVGSIRYYASAILIAALLIVFMTSVSSIEQLCDSENQTDIFGGYQSDISIAYTEDTQEKLNRELKNIEAIIEQRAEIRALYHINNCYVMLGDNQIMCTVTDNPKYVQNTLEGRKPEYDNEIMLTQMAADAYGIELGDTVQIAGTKKCRVTVTGLFQSTNDGGYSAMMLESGIKKVFPEYGFTSIKCLLEEEDESIRTGIVKDLKAEYQDGEEDFVITDERKEEEENVKTMVDAIKLISVVVFLLAMVFMAVISLMLCRKTVRREWKDFGIYKSFGYPNARLRQKFLLKYLMVVGIGVVFGIGMSVLVNNSLVNLILGSMGVSHFKTYYTVKLLLLPGGVLLLSAGLFAWRSSGKITKVSPKILMTE